MVRIPTNVAVSLAIVCTTLAVSGALGCGGGSSTSTFRVLGGPDGGQSLLDGSSIGFDGSLVLSSSSSGGEGGAGGTDGSSPQGALTITPLMPVVTVTTGQAVATEQFNAYVGGTQTAVGWSIDRGELGTISASGLFTPAGTLGGVGNITAMYGMQMQTTTITVVIDSSNQGDPAYSATPGDAGAGGYGGVGGGGPGAPPSAAQMTTLTSTPTADTSVSLLYPYDGTVWPQGLLAPLLQWNPGAHSFDSVYVHIQEKAFEYQGYFAANKTPFVNLPIPQSAWDTMSYSNGGDAVTVTLVFGEAANAFGPYTETWTVAQAALQGEKKQAVV